MNESLRRLGQGAALLFSGIALILVFFVFPGSVRERAEHRAVRSAVLALADGETTADPRISAEGRTYWLLPESGDLIVRTDFRGFQSILDIVFRLDVTLDLVRYRTIFSTEGAHVQPALASGMIDEVTGASVTGAAIQAAVEQVRYDMTVTRREER